MINIFRIYILSIINKKKNERFNDFLWYSKDLDNHDYQTLDEMMI